MDAKAMIEQRAKGDGLTVRDWREDEDGTTAVLGRFRVIEEDEDTGLYDGDEGELSACVVGAAEYGNERVSYSLKIDGYDEGNEVRDLFSLEEI